MIECRYMRFLIGLASACIVLFPVVAQASFEFEVRQNARAISVKNHMITLKKDPFSIVLSSKERIDVLVHASFRPDSISAAKKNKELNGIPVFKKTEGGGAIIETILNPNRSMFVSDEGYNAWWFENEREHRFNKVTKKDGWIKGTRSIKYLEKITYHPKTFDPISSRIPVRKVNKPLYLFFVEADYDKNYKLIERQRDYITINWKAAK